jgi:hypothetical protein
MTQPKINIEGKKKCVIFDIDGTLSLPTEERLELVRNKKKNWPKFLSMCDTDLPNWPVVNMFNSCWQALGFPARDIVDRIYIVSGRDKKYRDKTVKWLQEQCGIEPYMYTLYMRGDLYSGVGEDYRQDTLVKEQILYHIAENEDYWPLYTVDDRQTVVDMWRKNGILCMQVAEGDF